MAFGLGTWGVTVDTKHLACFEVPYTLEVMVVY